MDYVARTCILHSVRTKLHGASSKIDMHNRLTFALLRLL